MLYKNTKQNIRLKLFFVSVIMLQITVGYCQNIDFKGSFTPKDMSAANVYVLGNIGQNNVLAEAKVVDGVFNTTLPANLPKGIYKLAFGMQEKVYFYFIHDGASSYQFDFMNQQNAWSLHTQSGINNIYVAQFYQKQNSLLPALKTLYFFVGQYPEKKSIVYKTVIKTLYEKKLAFENFRKKAITNAPIYAKEVLQQNKMYFYSPELESTQIEIDFEKNLWDNVPKNDSLFYTKPFFGDLLEKFFLAIIEDRTMPESERYFKLKTKIQFVINQLKDNPYKTKYLNLMIRFFANNQYPYLIQEIDKACIATDLIAEDDKIGFNYRQKQQLLFGKKIPEIINSEGKNIFENDTALKKILVFVGNNTAFANQCLSKLNTDYASDKNCELIAINLNDNSESIKNFKNLFPNWKHPTFTKDQIKELISKYNLIYAPTLFEIKQDLITMEIELF